jgi:DNA-binding NarL/FixJ family response regulator
LIDFFASLGVFYKMTQKVKIVLATNQQVVSIGITSILDQIPEVELSGIAQGKQQLLEMLVVHQPAILIIDRWFDQMFLEANWDETNSLTEKYKTILFSDPDKESIYRLHKLHITSFFTLHSSAEEVIQTIRGTIEGVKFFTPKVVEALIEFSFRRGPEKPQQQLHDDLSEREMEVLMLITQGRSTKYIADKLFLSTHTVYTHRKNILKKLSCKSAAELINYAYTQGLVEKD